MGVRAIWLHAACDPVARAAFVRIYAMSMVEQILQAEELFNWSRDYRARSIAVTRGPMSDEDLKWEVALRQHGANSSTRQLIDGLRNRASR